MTRLLPDAGERIDLDLPRSLERLAELYRPEREEWLRVNSVLSVTGGAAGADGTSDSLTNPTDRALLGVIRRLADVVLVGAGSVRAEGRMLSRHSVLAVVTGSGDLTGHRFDSFVAPGRLLVICPPHALPNLEKTLVDVSFETVVVDAVDGRMPPSVVITALRGRGLPGIVCEGGPTLMTQLVSADLVDELCLTTSPTFTSVGSPLVGSPDVADRRLDLTQLISDGSGALYARWRVRPGE